MRKPTKRGSGEDERAHARLLVHFEAHPESVFYSRQLEVLFEDEFFHWVTNRALVRLVKEREIVSETRQLLSGYTVKLLLNRRFRFYRRAATEVYDLVNRYSVASSSGALGLQGEALVLQAFARRQFILRGEAANAYQSRQWTETGHDIDFIFEREGIAYGVEVKNTLGYLDFEEFRTKILLCHQLGIRPVFAVRALPRSWAYALIVSGGYAMILRYQLYPWAQHELAQEIREKLRLPVDAPRRLADTTMQRFEAWIAAPDKHPADIAGGRQALDKIRTAMERGKVQWLVRQSKTDRDGFV